MAALEELEVWKRGRGLAVEVYRVMATCNDFGFRDQITRASVSIPSNIAEGYERNSRRDFANFWIARGSCAELRTQLYIGRDIGWIEKTTAERLLDEALQLSKMFQGLINRCKSQDNLL